MDPESRRVFGQTHADIRFEWGPIGAAALASSCDVLVVVDIFSFTTAVDVATSRGGRIYPTAHRDQSAEDLARNVGARLAVDRRSISTADPYSLWPRSLMEIPSGTRLVLPSPNGSAISSLAVRDGCHVLAGCFRNRTAVAEAAGTKLGATVAVVASGERWPDGSLRPALEDLLGAGAIIDVLIGKGRTASPEAIAASSAFKQVASELQAVLSRTASSIELVALGFDDDVAIAGLIDVSTAVPTLKDGAFQNLELREG